MMNVGAKRREEWGRAHAKGAEDAEGKGRPPIEEDWGRCFCCDVTRRSKEFSEFYPSCLSSFIGS